MSINFPTVLTAPLSLAAGAFISHRVFNRLTHIAQFYINKNKGDYKNPEILKNDLNNHSGKIIVSAGYRDYFYEQNCALSIFVATTSAMLVRTITGSGQRSANTTNFLIGAICTPVICALTNIWKRQQQHADSHTHWVHVSSEHFDAHHKKHGTADEVTETMMATIRLVYFKLGDNPVTIHQPEEQFSQ